MKKINIEEVYRRYTEVNLELLEEYTTCHNKHKTRCHCGKIWYVIPKDIFRKHVKSCGCLNDKRRRSVGKDLLNKKFGKLTVIEFDGTKYTKHQTYLGRYWRCQCECGNIVSVHSNQLVSGKTKSCGCNRNKYSESARKRTVNIINKQFGDLRVLSFDTWKGKYQVKYWLCKCKCGRLKSIDGSSLKTGATKSCGNCNMHRNGKRISLIQLDLYKLFNRGVLNFKSGSCCIDLALVINQHKVAIEYDSWEFHKNKDKIDTAKTQYLLNHGWYVLRIKSKKTLPKANIIYNHVYKLNDAQPYLEIVDKGWNK